jgi:aminoglycoside phosphotransferase (APT) family kinase protein
LDGDTSGPVEWPTMSGDLMHPDEVHIDAALVRRLVSQQFPELAVLPIHRMRTTGTVNAIYRLGDDLYARLSRVESWSRDLDREWHWLPILAPSLSLQIPEPVAQGRPTSEFPLPWAIYRWIEGQPYADELVEDEKQAAKDLAAFVAQMRAIPAPDEAPHGGRDPLGDLDSFTRAAIDASQGFIDRSAALAVWERAVLAPGFDGRSVWIHSDLLRPNLLLRNGRIAAVIDFGSAGVGDPAADVIAAWTVFGPAGRETYRKALGVDDGTWLRACGFALHQAVLIIPYYVETNPGFVRQAKRTVDQVLQTVLS